MATPNAERYITETELCAYFGVSRNYVGGLRRAGVLTGWRKFGHRYVYLREDLERIEKVFTTRWPSRRTA